MKVYLKFLGKIFLNFFYALKINSRLELEEALNTKAIKNSHEMSYFG